MNDPYRPIPCDLHSELELAVMRRLRLQAVCDEGCITGIATDLITRAGAEYLELTDAEGIRYVLRLDRIERLEVLVDGRRLL